MKDTLNHLFAGNSLSKAEANTILTEIAEGKYSEAEIASFLTVFRMRRITAEELSGLVKKYVPGVRRIIDINFSNRHHCLSYQS